MRAATQGCDGAPHADGRVLAQPAGHMLGEERDGKHFLAEPIARAEFLNLEEFVMFPVPVDD